MSDQISKELAFFKKHFEVHTGIKVASVKENREFYHWKRLKFYELNCNDLLKISDYIRTFFSTPGIYTHLSVKLHPFDGAICLTSDAKDIEKFLMK